MTLTTMLSEVIDYPEGTVTEEGSVVEHYKTVLKVKDTFKEWLRTVGLPNYYSPNKDGVFNVTRSLRKLLILLVDEP